MKRWTEYGKAQKLGQKDYREKMLHGQSPFLPVLDDILQNVQVENQLPLGLVEIPIKLVVGTKTAGRTAAFASNFMPLLDLNSEFGSKWVALCMAHVDEGIRDPIRCFEYMGRFYVQEGNKRVSVLKYFEAGSVTGNVTRVVPKYNDTPEVRLYYEFMHYYPLIQTYLLTFTKPGSYGRLQKAMGKGPEEKWTAEDRAAILSLYNWVEKAYTALGGDKLRATVGDVLLLLLRLYSMEELTKASPNELQQKIDALWDDVLALAGATTPSPSAKSRPSLPRQNCWNAFCPSTRQPPTHLKVAFIHERTPETSSWTSQHEFGRTQLDSVFEGKVETFAGLQRCARPERRPADRSRHLPRRRHRIHHQPQAGGRQPALGAVKHPTVRILNCSMEMPYASIRTYYTRVDEAKFITGAIAGAMAGTEPHRLCGGLPQLRRARQHQRLCAGCPHGQPPRPH